MENIPGAENIPDVVNNIPNTNIIPQVSENVLQASGNVPSAPLPVKISALKRKHMSALKSVIETSETEKTVLKKTGIYIY
jgi:hypothetical protein